MADFEFVDVDVFLSDYAEGVWYECKDGDEVEYEDCFVFADCVEGEDVWEVCDADDPEAE